MSAAAMSPPESGPGPASMLGELMADEVISRSSPQSLARLLSHISRERFCEGESIYLAGDGADYFYLLVEGTVTLVSPGGRQCRLTSRRFGEEAVSEAPGYLTDAVASSAITVLRIARSAMRGLADANPALKTELFFSLASHLAGETLTRPATASGAAQPGFPRRATLGWLLVGALPLLAMELGPRIGLQPNGTMFMAIFASTVAMWVCSLADDYIPALFALLATLLTGLAPPAVILSGFASEGFLMALSTLALGTVVLTSGLGYRFMLFLLHALPNNQFWHNVGLFATGMLLTPIIPTANGRVAMLAPFYADMVENLHLDRRGRAAALLALTCFNGASLFSAIFITSKSLNFAVFSLLSPQGQDRFQWIHWALAASVTAVVMLAAYALAAAIVCRNKEPSRLPKERVQQQRILLGNMSGREWAALGGIAFIALGIVTSSLHKVQPPWLGFAMLFGLLLCGMLDKKELKEKVDWTLLLYLSGISGIVAVFNHVGLDRALAAALPGLEGGMRGNLGLLVLLLFVLVNVIRLAVPSNATTVILATILMPLANAFGINEWLVGFAILVFSDTWFFPYQCSYYLQLQDMNQRDPMYDERLFLRFNALMNLARLLAVYAAFPYWQMLGLL
jgi:DASS family divalent anion:Na+ symporter